MAEAYAYAIAAASVLIVAEKSKEKSACEKEATDGRTGSSTHYRTIPLLIQV